MKNKVPIRTFTEWSDALPGFFEIDTVSHSSVDVSRGHLSTLNMTDIATCWVIPLAIPRKGAFEVLHALEQAQKICPFPILGLDFDNGREFLNEDMIEWCIRENITYTRSREYKKNDQAWIEEKNGSVIRKNVGRGRFEGKKALRLLEKLYKALYLYANYFQPCQKLLEKKREGSKTYKRHDKAKTPYQRVLESPSIDNSVKLKLIQMRNNLNMRALHQEILSKREELEKMKIPVPNPVSAVIQMQRNAVQKLLARESVRQSKVKTTMTETRKAISMLDLGTVFTCRDLLQEGQDRHSTDVLLCRLRDEGFIQRCGWGKYKLIKTTI